MKPTNKLRLVKRTVYVPMKATNAYGDVGTVSKVERKEILQQWWSETVTEENTYREVGEWRDVPLEEE